MAAKLSVARELEKSPKKEKVIVANGDDKYAEKFLEFKIENKQKFFLSNARPFEIRENGLDFTFGGKLVRSHLSGEFNLYNILAATTLANSLGVPPETIIRAVEKFNGVRGRMERVEAGQDFIVVVDYAHTADSMEKVYQVFQNHRKICVFGATGGGRDKWKRPEMGRVADAYCEEIILTDDDSYDENPREIAEEVKKGIANKNPKIIVDRREAIREGLHLAKTGDAVIITGKGTDPFIMGPKGSKIPWDDATVVREELGKLTPKKAV